MPYQKIPVNVPFWSNVSRETDLPVAEERRDVIKDISGATVRRPALNPFSSSISSSPATGQFYWEAKDVLLVTANDRLYSVTKDGNITDVGTFDLTTNNKRVIFAESPDLTAITTGSFRKVYITTTNGIYSYDGNKLSRLTNENIPSSSTHIVTFDTYLLANSSGSETFDESIFYSKAADPEEFEGAFFSAENAPDRLVAFHAGWDELALFGTTSIQHAYNDGVTPFAPIPGANIDDGTLSPYTIKRTDSSYFYLNSSRRLVRIDGRQTTVLSQAIDDILSDAPDFAGAEGEIVTFEGKTLYLLSLNERTFVYDYASNEWVGEWGQWNEAESVYKEFKARFFINIKPWGVTVCADKSTFQLYTLSSDLYEDGGEFAQEFDIIRSSVITGNIDHGIGREKRSNELKIRIKRGEFEKLDPNDINPKMLVRWRDNGSKVWSNFREVNLGFEGENEFYWSLYQLGSYRSRQYNFVCTDPVPFSIISVEEDVELQR
ncbi:MAG: hypothetical protein GY800_09030 [Planctomycetes bacterium]|nr:hypothetical protein [Planctomycetota bacterium]